MSTRITTEEIKRTTPDEEGEVKIFTPPRLLIVEGLPCYLKHPDDGGFAGHLNYKDDRFNSASSDCHTDDIRDGCLILEAHLRASETAVSETSETAVSETSETVVSVSDIDFKEKISDGITTFFVTKNFNAGTEKLYTVEFEKKAGIRKYLATLTPSKFPPGLIAYIRLLLRDGRTIILDTSGNLPEWMTDDDVKGSTPSAHFVVFDEDMSIIATDTVKVNFAVREGRILYATNCFRVSSESSFGQPKGGYERVNPSQPHHAGFAVCNGNVREMHKQFCMNGIYKPKRYSELDENELAFLKKVGVVVDKAEAEVEKMAEVVVETEE
jgi:hypothetical protein